MGEVLTQKRQTVVDRLRRRFEHYRRHHSSCVPRYETGADFLAEKNRQDTLVLKQRYLESKSKKSKTGKNSYSSEHHKHTAMKESTPDTQKVVAHPKAPKRHLETSPVVIQVPSDSSSDDVERSAKIAKSSSSEPNSSLESQQVRNKKHSTSSLLSQQQQCANKSASSSSTNRYPPNTESNNAQLLESSSASPVGVKDSVKPSHSKVEAVSSVVKNKSEKSSTTNECSSEATSSFTHGSNVVECKQEKLEKDEEKKSIDTQALFSNQLHRTMPQLPSVKRENSHPTFRTYTTLENESGSGLCQLQDDAIDYSENLELLDGQDPLSDSFLSIGGFSEDSDDEIRLDILNDLIDDVFINSADIMKDFGDFEDHVGNIKIVDDEDVNRTDILMSTLNSHFLSEADELTFSLSPEPDLQQPTGLFNRSSSSAASATVSQPAKPALTVASSSSSDSVAYVSSHQQNLSPYGPPPPLQPIHDNMSLDFKLAEPNPAALTLKQMAEQHQNMQQKHHRGSFDSSDRTTFNMDSFPGPMPFSFRNRYPPNGNYSTSKSTESSVDLFNSVNLDNMPYPGVEPLSTFKRETYPERQVQKQQRQLIMTGTGHTGQKSPPYSASTAFDWPSDVVGHSNGAAHRIGNQYLSTDNGSRANENRALNIGYETRSVQQVLTNRNAKQDESVRPYSSVYNSYIPQQNISSSVFSSPLSQNMSYSPQFTSAMEHLPLEYKVNQANAMSNVEQVSLQAAYPHPFMGHQPTLSQNMTREWTHVQLPQIGLNIGSYQHHDSFVPLPSTSNQMPSTSMHQNIHHYPYRAVGGHRQTSLSHLSHNNQPVMLRSQQMKTPFEQRQPLRVQHRLNPINMQAIATETASSASTTNASLYNVAQGSNQMNMNFFDGIGNSASDLLNFDPVLHGETSTSFPLLGEMEMLNK